MKTGVTISTHVRFERQRKGARTIVRTPEPDATDAPCGRLPRITRLMALAIHFDRLVRSGAVSNYAELARLGNVTRARITQIMNLLNLAPEIQEEILFLPRLERGRGEMCLRDLQGKAGLVMWDEQRALRCMSR